ncbi:hypothetical protein T484DRAFT_1825285 [Baffinella frigidus]|nr:hypothetical protein T484DRAFT_1825285 [Cryptophyta sp. CCMP2293]
MPSGSSALMLDSDFCRAVDVWAVRVAAAPRWTCGPCVRWLPLVPGQSLLPPRVPVCVLCFAKREIKEAEEVWEGEAGRCERCKTYFPSKAAMLAAKCSAHPDSEAAPPCRTFQQHRQCRTTLEAMEKMGISGEVREGGMDEQLKHKIAAIEEEVREGGVDEQLKHRIAAIEEEEKKIMEAEREREAQRTSEEKIIEAEREREAQRASIKAGKETEAFFEHLYVSGETLPGLALRYGVTAFFEHLFVSGETLPAALCSATASRSKQVQDIKRANGILHSNMDPGVKEVEIESIQEKLVRAADTGYSM